MIKMADVSTELCGIKLKNPLVLASGILGVTKSSLKNAALNGAGAVTIKSVSIDPRKGHNCPILLTYEAGIMNAVGYSNPGFKAALDEFQRLDDIDVPVIASIVGKDAGEFAYLTKNFVNKLKFDALEIPLSCPHTPGYGILAGQGTPEATYEITAAVKNKTRLPVFIKLTADVKAIGEVARAAEKAGADGITVTNTIGPGMVINIEAGKPILDFRVGGLSGPAIRPIAVRCVYDIYKAVKIPIIGTGGITTGRDAVEMLMAGATAVGLGSAIYYRGIDVFSKITSEIEEFMIKNNYNSTKEIIGKAHEE